jgi:translation initiation factor IF-3
MKLQQKKEVGPLLNEKIRFDKVQLITHDGENRGVVSRNEALNAARDVGLDLVIIAQSGNLGVPVAKVLDYGKLQYEKKKQQGEAKKKQQIIQIKEIKLRPKIAAHDFQTKMNMAIRFLEEGKHVKVTLQFRGREIESRTAVGEALFQRIESVLEGVDFGGKSLAKKDETTVPGPSIWSRIYSLKK